jgi:hypothetical protein
MTLRLKLVTTAIVSFLAGAVVVGALANYVLNRFLHDQFVNSYYTRAVDAQWTAHTLSRLRAGDTDKPIRDLELRLGADLNQFGSYESVVPPAQREAHVYQMMAEAQAYRAQFPVKADE